jgi:hypothetical protein
MTTKNFISAVIAVGFISMTEVALAASAYISHGKLEDELPIIISGSLTGIFLFLFINWLFKPKVNKISKTPKKRK